MSSSQIRPLSGDADGSGILITAANTGDAQVVHKAGDENTATEKITVWATWNTGTRPTLHFEWGVDTATRHIAVELADPSATGVDSTRVGWTLAIPGILLKSGLEIQCYATVASGSLGNVNLHGHAEIITG
tara:strand:+ start:852 stop:1244 length:393 start_codon:yes stop_codon:yes gene_type:complete